MMAERVVNIQAPAPRVEDGYIRIANELYDAILSYGFSGRQLHVLLAVARKTYGYGKKFDDMSASQVGALCGVARNHVTTTLKQLEALNVISCRPGRYGMVIGINKRYASWAREEKLSLGSPESGLVPIKDSGSPESGQVLVLNRDSGSPESGHTKDNPKIQPQKTTPKDIPAPQAAGALPTGARVAKPKGQAAMTADLQNRFERFYAAYPRKTDRKDAEKAFAKIAPSEELLAQMLAAIEGARAAGLFADRQYIKHPATWLNKGSWMDEVSTAYDGVELGVIEAYNDALGDSLGVIDEAIYTPSRAGLIQDFLTLSPKPAFWKAFFPWVRDNCDLPPRVGFDWLISRDGFSKVKGGQHQRTA